jgi:hypothetical protein
MAVLVVARLLKKATPFAGLDSSPFLSPPAALPAAAVHGKSQ